MSVAVHGVDWHMTYILLSVSPDMWHERGRVGQ